MFAFPSGTAPWIPRYFSILSILFGLLCLGFGQSAGADTYTVTNLSDSGVGSLRQAILDANARTGADTIVFAPGVTGTISLMTALPTLSDDVEIDGPGADLMTVARSFLASQTMGVLQIDAAVGTGPTVTLTGLTLAYGNSTGGGAGLKNVHGNVTLRNCMISLNQSDNFGAGIFNAGTMALSGCTVNDNTLGSSAANSGNYKGGGIYNTGTLTLTNSTLAQNIAHVSEAGRDWPHLKAGGIYNAGTLTLSHSTFAENYANIVYTIGLDQYGFESGQGNAIYSTGSFTLDNTVLLEALYPTVNQPGGTLVNAGGTVASHGYNLTDSTSIGLLTGVGDKVASGAILGPLQHNGGPTTTYSPVVGGPAVDAGDPAFNSPSATDQRGFARVIGSHIDIGSVEYRLSFDFDGDGHNDLLFQNSQTGQLAGWYMNGLTVQGGTGVSALPNAGWKVAGIADFNGDGTPDLVFQNTTTKQVVIWFMNGLTRIGGVQLPTPPSTYTLVGVGDFNGDGNPDLVFEDSAANTNFGSSGVSYNIRVWYLNKATFVSEATVLGANRNATYHVVGVGISPGRNRICCSRIRSPGSWSPGT